MSSLVLFDYGASEDEGAFGFTPWLLIRRASHVLPSHSPCGVPWPECWSSLSLSGSTLPLYLYAGAPEQEVPTSASPSQQPACDESCAASTCASCKPEPAAGGADSSTRAPSVQNGHQPQGKSSQGPTTAAAAAACKPKPTLKPRSILKKGAAAASTEGGGNKKDAGACGSAACGSSGGAATSKKSGAGGKKSEEGGGEGDELYPEATPEVLLEVRDSNLCAWAHVGGGGCKGSTGGGRRNEGVP